MPRADERVKCPMCPEFFFKGRNKVYCDKCKYKGYRYRQFLLYAGTELQTLPKEFIVNLQRMIMFPKRKEIYLRKFSKR